MKAAILKCDEVLEKFQPEFGDYTDMIKQLFDKIDERISFDMFDVRQDCYPQELADYDFYITTGSKTSAYENQPWIINFIEFVRRLDKEKKKLIGICFGHQIIALALNVPVKKSEKGWGIGVAENRIVERPDWMLNDLYTNKSGENTSIENKTILNMIVSHQDQVMTLPKAARVIAESDFCPYFMVQWNSHFLSVQGHPEYSAAYSRTMMNERKSIIPAQRIQEGLDSLAFRTRQCPVHTLDLKFCILLTAAGLLAVQ